MKRKQEKIQVGVRLNARLVKEVDNMIDGRKYLSRAHVIDMALLEFLGKHSMSEMLFQMAKAARMTRTKNEKTR